MRILAAFIVSAVSAPLFAAELRDVRVWASPESTRVVFDLDDKAAHKLYSLHGPERVVVDLPGVSSSDSVQLLNEARGLIQRVRKGRQSDGLRVVLDVNGSVKPKSFVLAPNGDYGYRLVVDLYPKADEPALPEQTPPASPTPPVQVAKPTPPSAPTEFVQKPIIVAIDAGHGGEDPGARGVNGAYEKDVVLQISKKLAKRINGEPGFKAVMIRDGDYYIGLRKRVDKARKAQADLFVSIHANSFTKDRDVHGSAVYVLSRRGASSEHARWLEQKENAADLIGGVDIQEKDDTLAAVLMDISQTSAIEASIDLGSRLLGSLGKVNKLQKADVQQAGFAVLKAPDIPSVLIETAFLSNEREAALLTHPESQERIVKSLHEGIMSYFASYRPMEQVAFTESAASESSEAARAAP